MLTRGPDISPFARTVASVHVQKKCEMPKQGTRSGPNRARPAAIDSDLCAFAQAWQDARGERDREGEGDSKDKHRSSHACCHQQAALSRRLALGDAAVGARGGGSGASDGAGAQQAAEALQAGFDGGAPAPACTLEAAVDRLLARAHALSPGVYTHAHCYVPSESVWCVA